MTQNIPYNQINTDVYEEPTEKPPYPVEASGWGKNSYYHHCDIHGWQVNFAVCVTLLKRAEEGNTSSLGTYTHCIDKIKRGECPAVKMRQQEIEAGEALYYLPRLKVKQSAHAPRMKRYESSSSMNTSTQKRLDTFERKLRGEEVQSYQPAAPKLKPKKSAPADQPLVMDMGQMVNDMMKESSKPSPKLVTDDKKSESVQITTKIERLPGETPLQFARRKAQMKETV